MAAEEMHNSQIFPGKTAAGPHPGEEDFHLLILMIETCHYHSGQWRKKVMGSIFSFMSCYIFPSMS